MRYRIDYSPESVEALDNIAEYLAERSAIAPFSVLGAIKAKIESIASMPRIGQVEERRPRLRRFLEEKYQYWIFYEIVEDRKTVPFMPFRRRNRSLKSIGEKNLPFREKILC